MARNVLILGASYGSLLGTKLAMAGHNATLVCRQATADLINTKGTDVRLRLRDEAAHRSLRSADFPGQIDAATPQDSDPAAYDLVVLAMQEPQYRHPDLRGLLARVAEAKTPCLSLMNMPPLPFMQRLADIDTQQLAPAYSDPSVWDRFEPGLVTLCSPDPQAFRPPEEAANVLHVGLPTNFKTAPFADEAHTAMLRELERDIAAVRLNGKDVPVKLRVFNSLFVPMAKWAMLMAGNYRCVTETGIRPIAEAVHSDTTLSQEIYEHVNRMATTLGADEADLVPFEKYAAAAKNLLKPSSAARAVAAGAPVERVDRIVQALSRELRMPHPEIDLTVARIDAALAASTKSAA